MSKFGYDSARRGPIGPKFSALTIIPFRVDDALLSALSLSRIIATNRIFSDRRTLVVRGVVRDGLR